jgi:adenylate cyclase
MEDRRPDTPRVRFSLLWKITLPFMLLAMVLGLGATYVVDQLLSEEETGRFLRQLVDGGQQAKDAVVRSEVDMLELERLIANTEGVSDAAAQANAEDLRSRVLPLAFNANADVVAILDNEGTSLLTVRRRPGAPAGDYDSLRGETYYADWAFVQRILQGVTDEVVGDKHAGLEAIVLDGIEHHVFFVGGPLTASERTLTGAVLVGEYANRLVGEIGDEAGANISIYDLDAGRNLSTTLEPDAAESINLTANDLADVGSVGEGRSPVRSMQVSGSEYWEVLTPLDVRQGTESLGIMGISLVRVELETTSQGNLGTVLQFGVVGLALIVLIGLLLSNSITKPLSKLVEASTQVARGNLQARVKERGSDEIGVLATTFNRMVEGLREGSIYRDLLGRTVTPEVREKLRTAFADGGSLLKGQSAEATILFADFRSFTAHAESVDPEDVMQTLNDYFSGVVPIISVHGGVVNKFDGDSVMAFFGILPQHLPPRVSAFKATHAGLAMIEHIRKLNERRTAEGKTAFGMGIGISTGTVIAGGLGSEDRVHYTVVGDTVNTAQRIQQVSLDLGGSALVISEETYRKLGSVRSQFRFGKRGLAQLKGRQQEVMIFEVVGRESDLVGRRDLEKTIEIYTGSLPRVARLLSGDTSEIHRRASEEELEFLEERLEGSDTGPLRIEEAPSGEDSDTPDDESGAD